MDQLMDVIHNALQRAQNRGVIEDFEQLPSNLFRVELPDDEQVYYIGEVHPI